MHSALKEQLLGLKDLNQQMTKETTNLTRALKGDSKMQGNWGELVLERVLEDFVLMFIPIEPAFAVAINEDNSIYSKAFEKNIVIVTPSTLLATLRTIDTMWNNEKQQQNAIEIARQAGALYDKFEGLVTDLTGVGKKIDAAKNDYSSAMISQGVSEAQTFIFSVEDNEKQTIEDLNRLQGRFVKLHYFERYKTLFWLGDTKYFITKVEEEKN